MDWPTRMQEGFALAAAAHADPGAALAAAGLSPDAQQRATELARELASSERTDRRRWLRGVLAAAGGPRPDLCGVPPRALALLATAAPRELGRSWLAAAPLPRAGYVPDPDLLAVLRRLAAREPR